MATTIAIFSLIVSLITAFWAFKAIYVSTCALTESTFVQVEQMLARVPKAVRFHGISLEQMQECGVNEQEFAYLLASFTAGGIGARARDEKSKTPFPPGSYRRTMLEAEHTRKAWPLIRVMMSDTPYRRRIEATIALIERAGAHNAQTVGSPLDERMMSASV